MILILTERLKIEVNDQKGILNICQHDNHFLVVHKHQPKDMNIHVTEILTERLKIITSSPEPEPREPGVEGAFRAAAVGGEETP
jgi:hypothetical protein